MNRRKAPEKCPHSSEGVARISVRNRLQFAPDNEPLWIRLYVYQIGDKWAAMLVADDAPPPEPGSLTGQAFFGETPEEAEQAAKVFLGYAEPVN